MRYSLARAAFVALVTPLAIAAPLALAMLVALADSSLPPQNPPAGTAATTRAQPARARAASPDATLRADAAMRALDRYLETWNSRDPKRWASSLHFPHVRPGPGAFELSSTAEQYAAGVNFAQTLATGWHHSEWTARRVLQVGVDKVHVAGAWQRYTADDRPLVGSVITYIVTNQHGRWGVLSRFAAGPTGLDAEATKGNNAAALAALDVYVKAWNSHDPETLAAALHFPHVRIDGNGQVELASSTTEFLAGPEPGRQRTWFETRLDQAEVVQTSANGVNVAVTCSRRDRKGQILSSFEAIVLVVRRDNAWKVQALSTM
ncbi:MAG: hypothetical protein ACT4QD_01805 [Acidobacteriota bacterium]